MTSQTGLTENQVLDLISRDKLMETNRAIAQWIRLSGSPEERTAFEYVKSQLDSYGLRTTWLEHPALISYPLQSSLELIDRKGKPAAAIACLTHAFSTSVDHLEGELVDLGFGTPGDFAGKDLRGRVALMNGLARPTAVYQAEQAGAVAQVFVNDDHLHNMIVTTIWGTPTPESAVRMPHSPVVSVVDADGDRLRERIAAGETRVRMTTRVFTGWRVTPIVVGDLDAGGNGDYVLLSGHLDSWEYGAMDNGSANATMLEAARVLALGRSQLQRGLRVAFWSGHSHGRYAGSTWYADNHWEDLYDHCVAHVNVDSTGARGATFYGTFETHMELSGLGAAVIREHTGQESKPARMSRAGDMSFNGVGIPALFMELSQVPVTDAARNNVTISAATFLGGSMPWWWHTSQDTMDKIDPTVLALDTRVYASALWRLTTQPLLPIDPRPAIADIVRELDDLARGAGDCLDLSPLCRRAAQLAGAVEQMMPSALGAHDPSEIARWNGKIKGLSRVLVPLTYTAAGNFDHDPAWGMPFLPILQPVRQLTGLDRRSDQYQFLRTRLVRSINQVSSTLRRAIEIATG